MTCMFIAMANKVILCPSNDIYVHSNSRLGQPRPQQQDICRQQQAFRTPQSLAMVCISIATGIQFIIGHSNGIYAHSNNHLDHHRPQQLHVCPQQQPFRTAKALSTVCMSIATAIQVRQVNLFPSNSMFVHSNSHFASLRPQQWYVCSQQLSFTPSQAPAIACMSIFFASQPLLEATISLFSL